jgi:hypothetical protein
MTFHVALITFLIDLEVTSGNTTCRHRNPDKNKSILKRLTACSRGGREADGL